MALIFDIETDGLLRELSTFYVGVTQDSETGEIKTYYTPEALVEALRGADEVVGHNITGYDIPALELLTGGDLSDLKVTDTLLLAKLVFYSKPKNWGFSLDAMGKRLKEEKLPFKDFSHFSEEMVTYCKQDVKVTMKLYKELLKRSKWLPREALEIEQKVNRLMIQQMLYGWLFDVKKAQKMHIELAEEEVELLKALQKEFPPMFLAVGKPKKPKKPFKRNGVLTIGEHQPIKLTQFNPGSGAHIVHWVLQKDPNIVFPITEKGNPKTDADTLREMFDGKDWAESLLKYKDVVKLLGQLALGPKSWLTLVGDDKRLHGSADILGTVTGRFTHANPNMAQVPSVRAYKGPEVRALFKAKPGYLIVGADASGLELRMLSHYMAPFDGGAYGEALLKDDIHTVNQKAAGLPTRDNAKTFIYGFLYGAGNAKIASIIDGTPKMGAVLKKKFTEGTPGLKELITKVKLNAQRGYLKGLTGRRLFIRSPHSALNTLLQSGGAYYMKYVWGRADEILREKGYDFHWVGNIHDELQAEVHEDQAEAFARDIEQVFPLVGEELGLRIKMEGEAKIGKNWKETH